MATAIENVTMDTLNALKELVYTAATSEVAAGAETFTFTPTGSRGILIADTIGGASATKSCTFSISAGTAWAAKAITGTFTLKKAFALEVDTARVKGAAGLITVVVTGGTGEALKTNHVLKLSWIDLI